MSNPYEAPRTPVTGGEIGGAGPGSPAVEGKVPVGAYILAIISGLFVTFGSMIVAAFSPMFLGDWPSKVSGPLLAAIPIAAIGLGLLSAWQSIRQARRKALAKAKLGRP